VKLGKKLAVLLACTEATASDARVTADEAEFALDRLSATWRFAHARDAGPLFGLDDRMLLVGRDGRIIEPDLNALDVTGSILAAGGVRPRRRRSRAVR